MTGGSKVAVRTRRRRNKPTWDDSDIGVRRGPRGYAKRARELARGLRSRFASKTELAQRIANIIREEHIYSSADEPVISTEWIARIISPDWDDQFR
jgi:hypothetical protein